MTTVSPFPAGSVKGRLLQHLLRSKNDPSWDAIESLGYERLVAIGNPIRADGHFALLSDQGDRDALEHRPPQVSCKHFVVPSTMSPHAHLARSPVGLADKVWLEAVGREPGENSPWYRSHVLAQRPKLRRGRLIRQEWLNLALSDSTAAARLEDFMKTSPCTVVRER